MFNYYYYTNSYYMLGNILVLVGVALMALAQMKVSSAYNKYSKVQNSRHLTGYDVAREFLINMVCLLFKSLKFKDV